MLPSRVIVI